jgi:hypothetical protein
VAKVVTLDLEKFVNGRKAAVAGIDKHVLGGGCTDYAEYRANVGRRKGLMESIEAINLQLNQGDDDND